MGSPDPRQRLRSRSRWQVAGGLALGLVLLLEFGPSDLEWLRLSVVGLLLAGCVVLVITK